MADLRDIIEQKAKEKADILTNSETNDKNFIENLYDLCTLNLLSDNLPEKEEKNDE